MKNYELSLIDPLISHREATIKYAKKFKEQGGSINSEDKNLLRILDSYDNYGNWVVNNTIGRIDGSSTFFVLDKSCDEFVGNVNIRYNCKLADEKGNIGYAVRPDLRGQGLGTEIVALTVSMCQMLDLGEITAVVEKDNIASVRVLEKNGFIRVTGPTTDDNLLFALKLN